MEISQGNSRYNYLKQAKISYFFFYKIREQEERIDPARWGEADTSDKEEDVGEGCRRMNMIQIVYTHVCKWKNVTG
jgi:hypothetical protein